ncbi:hypothetical protein ISCGN_003949 [Ixodes scapularis]
MRRSGLCLRRRTSICQRLPDAYEEKLFAFRRYVLSLRREQGYAIGQIGNADQTPVYFDMTRSTTVTKRGSRQVNILSTGNERSRFTVMLAATADGWKLPPFLVFKRKTLPKERFPHNVIVRTNEKGFFNDDLVLEWLRLVWDRRPGALLGLPNMLVLDSFRGHLTAKIKEKLRSSGTDLVVIPGGMTSQLQPLDVMLNKPFKDRVRKLYTEWMGKTDNPLTPTGRVKRASLAEVASWVAAAWYNLPDELVARSFKKCGLSNAMDGTEDDAVYEDTGDERIRDLIASTIHAYRHPSGTQGTPPEGLHSQDDAQSKVEEDTLGIASDRILIWLETNPAPPLLPDQQPTGDTDNDQTDKDDTRRSCPIMHLVHLTTPSD